MAELACELRQPSNRIFNHHSRLPFHRRNKCFVTLLLYTMPQLASIHMKQVVTYLSLEHISLYSL